MNSPIKWALRWPCIAVLAITAHGAVAFMAIGRSHMPTLMAASAESVIDIEFLTDAPPEPEPEPKPEPESEPEPAKEDPPPEPEEPTPAEVLPLPTPEPELEKKVEVTPPLKKEPPKPATRKENQPPPPKPKSAPAKRASPPTAPRGLATKVSIARRSTPAYPRNALRNRIQGTVYVLITVNSSGRAASVSISRSSGNRDLDNAALSAARRTRFNPARNDGGTPMVSRTIIPFPFVIR
ncbi:MAG: energy transducer TonB [Verrucomicrobiota bacterium]